MKSPISFETSVNWRLHQVWSLVGAEKWQSFLQLWQLLKRPGDCCPNWTTLFVFVFVFVWKLNYCQNFDLLSSMYCECIQFHLQYGDSIPPMFKLCSHKEQKDEARVCYKEALRWFISSKHSRSYFGKR